MARIKPFVVRLSVTPELAKAAELDGAIMERLQDQADAELRGPRGGRYERVSDLRISSGIDDDDFMRNRMTYLARFDGRYVRSNRRTTAV